MLGYVLTLVTFILLATPAVRYIRDQPRELHWPALSKAFFLWLVSTSPVISGILLSSPNDEEQVAQQLQGTVLSNFTISEMFVYSAAFLAPVLFVVFDIVKSFREGDLKPADLTKHMRGMQWVVLSAIAILMLTLLAYSSSKTDAEGFSQTYLALFLSGKGFIVYLTSLAVWYSVILWEATPKTSYVIDEKRETQTFSNDYAKRRGEEV